jgi:hypothetical protein
MWKKKMDCEVKEMEKKYYIIIGTAGVVFGLCNIVPVFLETRWYCALCFVILGVPETIAGMIAIGLKKPQFLRTQSWGSIIGGCSILFLSLSDFYRAQALAGLNFIAAAGLTVAGIWGLYISTTKAGLSIIP